MRLLPLLGLAGCYAPSVTPGTPCAPTGQCPGGLVCGPTNLCELPGAQPPDASSPLDAASPPDAPAVVPPDAPGPVLIAHYTFDGTLEDATSMHDGSPIGTELAYGAGQVGQALLVPRSATSWVRVADSPAFDVPSGKLELWFNYASDALAGDLGLVSRDASGTAQSGHIGIRLGYDRRVVLRIQVMGDLEAYRCTSAPVSAGAWHRVEASFGPAGLTVRVDGAEVTGTSWTSGGGTVYSCTTPWTTGIDGNDNPLVIGGLTATSVEGTGAPVTAVAGGVAIDDVKLWALP